MRCLKVCFSTTTKTSWYSLICWWIYSLHCKCLYSRIHSKWIFYQKAIRTKLISIEKLWNFNENLLSFRGYISLFCYGKKPISIEALKFALVSVFIFWINVIFTSGTTLCGLRSANTGNLNGFFNWIANYAKHFVIAVFDSVILNQCCEINRLNIGRLMTVRTVSCLFVHCTEMQTITFARHEQKTQAHFIVLYCRADCHSLCGIVACNECSPAVIRRNNHLAIQIRFISYFIWIFRSSSFSINHNFINKSKSLINKYSKPTI